LTTATENGFSLESWSDTGLQYVIVSDAGILGGTPCFRGTRVPVDSLIDYLEAGDTYTSRIYLGTLADCCQGLPEKPGVYWLEAVFVYSDLGGWPAPLPKPSKLVGLNRSVAKRLVP
jgi:hypothetical protein